MTLTSSLTHVEFHSHSPLSSPVSSRFSEDRLLAGDRWLCYHLVQRHSCIDAVNVECAHQVAPPLDGNLLALSCAHPDRPKNKKETKNSTAVQWCVEL